MLISAFNIKLTCEWIKPLNWTTKTLARMSYLSLGLPTTVHSAWISDSNEVLSYRVGQSACSHRDDCFYYTVKVNARQLQTYRTRKCKMSTLFSDHYIRNRSTLEIGVLGYISIVQNKEHSPEDFSIPPGTPCISIYLHSVTSQEREDLISTAAEAWNLS